MTLLTAWLLALVPLGTRQVHAQPVMGTVDGRTFFLPMVMREASRRGLPPEIADAVAMVETGYRPNAVGSSGEIGLMQVMPATAAQLGFRGSLAELADPDTNIRLGVTYLAQAWAASGGDICRALTKYRAGLGEEVETALSAQYCARATAWLMGASALAQAAASPPAAQAPDPYVIVMPPVRRQPRTLPMPPMPAGVSLTPIFASAHSPLFPQPKNRSRDARKF